MIMKTKIILLIILSLVLSSGISAKENIKKTPADAGTLDYTLPEITVKGDNSMNSLEMAVIRAEELKYEVFNNLNSTDDFDITCEWQTPMGTKIKRWSCDVGFMKKAREEDARAWTQGIVDGETKVVRSDDALVVQFTNKFEALNREMKELAIRHPELAVAVINAHELEQLYKEKFNRKYKDSIFVGDPPEPDLVLNKISIWEAAFLDHRNGRITDATWERWDSLYSRIFKMKSYQRLWKSADYNKYDDEFVAYVNEVVDR